MASHCVVTECLFGFSRNKIFCEGHFGIMQIKKNDNKKACAKEQLFDSRLLLPVSSHQKMPGGKIYQNPVLAWLENLFLGDLGH